MLNADLLEFNDPPLVEVVIGVQFAPQHEYRPFRAKDVWDLYRDKFPTVQEQPFLAPQFETFGAHNQNIIQMNLMNISQQIRYWFLSNDESELIQYQNDRFIHNWRKNGKTVNSYPRFEYIFNSFKSELSILENYNKTNLHVNQCEISYINLIELEMDDLQFSKWVKFDVAKDINPNDINISLRKVIPDNGKPNARLYLECNSAITQRGTPAIALQFTLRGAPKDTKIDSALEFIRDGRNVIADTFLKVTTDSAQASWGRVG